MPALNMIAKRVRVLLATDFTLRLTIPISSISFVHNTPKAMSP
jgi:hypothetical protein